jgi:hypothetical protein
MPWLIALMLTIGVMAAAETACAAVYVPGHLRNGIYTHPHFLSSPDARYDREIKLDQGQDNLPKPTIGVEPPDPAKLPPDKLPPDKPS